MGIQKQWISREEFEAGIIGGISESAHTHLKVDITDTPWAWADVSKTGSNLTDLATRQHAGLTNITENQHHNKVHALVGTYHTASGLTIGWVIKATGATTFAWGQLAHDKLGGLGDDDHTQYHNDARGDARYYTKTQLQTSGQAQVHWNNITNEPQYYPPEFHYHVGKEIVSLHLVDLDDVEADDIFDVLNTGNIHGQGNYDWFGTWVVTADASTQATVNVLSGSDKYLYLLDNSAVGKVSAELVANAGHEMITAVIEFEGRMSATDKTGYFSLGKDAIYTCGIRFFNNGQIGWVSNGVRTDMQAYSAAPTWYKIRIHIDCVSRYAMIFIDNVFKLRQALSTGAEGDYINKIRLSTIDPHVIGFGINNLKIFNLTI